MISIPSLPATPAVVKAAPQQTPSSSVSDNDPNSFASYLKSIQNRQPEKVTNATSTVSVKDKTAKDSKKNEDPKNKQPLLTDAALVPATNPTPPPTPRALQLAWSQTKGNTKGENLSSPTAARSSASLAGPAAINLQARNSPTLTSQEDDSQDVKTRALKGSVSDAIANAPVAFGANLSKVDVLKADGIKASEAKAGELKANEARSKASSAESAKNVAEVPKASESKAFSGNQQQHADSSNEDPTPAAGNTVKGDAGAGGQSAAGQLQGFAALHSAASSDQVPVAGAAVQNAYAPTGAAVEKAAPAASTTVIAEPAQTPTVRSPNIDLKITGADNSQVDVRVSQRAGDVQVTVRTPDGDLSQSLRQHLPELSDRLAQAGVSGDLWQPQTASASNTSGNDTDSRPSDDAQAQQQSQQQQQNSRGSSSHGGQQQEGDTPRSAWLNELNQANKGSN